MIVRLYSSVHYKLKDEKGHKLKFKKAMTRTICGKLAKNLKICSLLGNDGGALALSGSACHGATCGLEEIYIQLV